jgi:hypothetical protein
MLGGRPRPQIGRGATHGQLDSYAHMNKARVGAAGAEAGDAEPGGAEPGERTGQAHCRTVRRLEGKATPSTLASACGHA